MGALRRTRVHTSASAEVSFPPDSAVGPPPRCTAPTYITPRLIRFKSLYASPFIRRIIIRPVEPRCILRAA